MSPWFIVSGQYETEVTNHVLRTIRPDYNCIDVGSNFGYYTCLMARFAPSGRVIGIEADRHVYEIARDNIAINGFGHARAIHAAAGAISDEVSLFRRRGRSGNTSVIDVGELAEQLGEKPAEPFTVNGLRIDDLAAELAGRVDLMKIDVEGAEPMVIAGAKQTIIANAQIAIVMEWSPGQIQAAGFDVRKFLDDLRDLGLSPQNLEIDRAVPISYDELINLPYRAGVVLTRNSPR